MNSTIDYEPKELSFPHPELYKTHHTLVLFNNSPSEFASFSFKNPKQKYFTISPLAGLLYPRTSVTIEIILVPNLFYKENVTESFEVIYRLSESLSNLTDRFLAQQVPVKRIMIKAYFRTRAEDATSKNASLNGGVIFISPQKTLFKGERSQMNNVSILYGCDVSSKMPLNKLYFEPNSGTFERDSSLGEEVRMYRCIQCLQEVSEKEAIVQSGRCSFCCECPVCSSKLNFLRDDEGYFYFDCLFCRWNSLIIRLRDPKSSGLLQQIREYESRLKNEVAGLLLNRRDRIKLLQREIESSQKSSREPMKRRSDWSHKRGEDKLGETLNHAKISKSPSSTASLNQIMGREEQSLQAFMSSDFQYTEQCSFHQRLENPSLGTPPNLIARYQWPNRKQLRTKIFRRSNEQLIVKRSKSGFDLDTNATQYIPSASIINWPVFTHNQPRNIFLLLRNPQSVVITIMLSQASTIDTTAIVECSDQPMRVSGLKDFNSELLPSSERTSKEFETNEWLLGQSQNTLTTRIRVTPLNSHGKISFCIKVRLDFDELKQRRSVAYYMFFNLGNVSQSIQEEDTAPKSVTSIVLDPPAQVKRRSGGFGILRPWLGKTKDKE